MDMTFSTFLVFILVALVIIIKLGLLALALILIGRGLFGRGSNAACHPPGIEPPLSKHPHS